MKFKQIIPIFTLLLIACGSSSDSSAQSCTITTLNKCSVEDYCYFRHGSCGRDSSTGECVRRPEVCAEIYAPVCGCDGRTYENECKAHGRGISVEHSGECGDKTKDKHSKN